MEIPSKFQNYRHAFRWHFHNGTRGGIVTGVAWKPDEFVRALKDKLGINYGGEHFSRTLKGWLEVTGSGRPYKAFYNAIYLIFFDANHPTNDGEYFYKLWRNAAKRDSFIAMQRDFVETGTGRASAPPPDQEPSLDRFEFENIKRERRVPRHNVGLFDIGISDPPQGSTPSRFWVLAEFNVGIKRGREAAFRWEMGIKRFDVLNLSQGCLLTPGFDLSDGVALEGGAWIIGNGQSVLRGNMLHGQALALMEHDNNADQIDVILRAECWDTDLHVEFVGEKPPTYSRKRLAVINRFIQKCQCEADEPVFLGEVQLNVAIKQCR